MNPGEMEYCKLKQQMPGVSSSKHTGSKLICSFSCVRLNMFMKFHINRDSNVHDN